MDFSYKVQSFGITDQGLVRKNNEDLWHELIEHRFFLLADGMGGHRAGEVAAKETVQTVSSMIQKLFSSEVKNTLSKENLLTHINKAIQEANSRVRTLSKQDESLSGMGTTLCCALVHEDSLLYAHVGDSRIYRFREKLELLTEDHSLRQQLIKTGLFTKEKIHSFPYKNVITRAIGSSKNVEPDIASTPLEPNDLYLLCSDGLTDHLSDEEISAILSCQSDIEHASESLVAAAKDKGGHDNITVVLIKIFHENHLPRQ